MKSMTAALTASGSLSAIARLVADADELRVLVGSPGGAVVEQVQRAIATEHHVHRSTKRERTTGFSLGVFTKQLHRAGERFDGDTFFTAIKPHPFEKRSAPIVDQQALVVVTREAAGLLELWFPIEHRASTSGAPAGTQLRRNAVNPPSRA